MAVQAVVDDVDLGADEPLVERLLALIQDLIPLAVPLQLLGLLGPEPLEILLRQLGRGLPVLEQRLA